jgi:hypothetical protein
MILDKYLNHLNESRTNEEVIQYHALNKGTQFFNQNRLKCDRYKDRYLKLECLAKLKILEDRLIIKEIRSNMHKCGNKPATRERCIKWLEQNIEAKENNIRELQNEISRKEITIKTWGIW